MLTLALVWLALDVVPAAAGSTEAAVAPTTDETADDAASAVNGDEAGVAPPAPSPAGAGAESS